MQRLYTPDSGNGKVQSSVSAGNTERDHIQSGDLQGVQAEVKASEYDHFTITDDAEGRVLSILFDGKPTDAVREVLKANAFVWNKKKGEWFRSGKWYKSVCCKFCGE